jgi:branched-chain amino acid aminotransferase
VSSSMNIFFFNREEGDNGELELVTPPLNGFVLPGVTRDSVLKLARGFEDMKVSD